MVRCYGTTIRSSDRRAESAAAGVLAGAALQQGVYRMASDYL